ncbi:AEC family transporter [Sporosarcina sp. OR05]|uniref:AEC family transporter n=1 Tax=Sporosarcina sp. OR05 TaxID=2969819 RepID=UPI00352A081B
MLSIATFMQVLLPLYLIASVGFIARKINVFHTQTNHVSTQLLLNITLPALIIYSLNTKLTKELLISFEWLVAMSLFILGSSVIVAFISRKKARLPEQQKSVFESLIIFGNQGFIGYAIIFMLMAEEGIVYLTIFNSCYLLLIWSYGIYLFTKGAHKVNWKGLIVNPGIVSTLIGIVMMVLPLSWPEAFVATVESIGKMTIPLSMLLIGSLLADMRWQTFRQYGINRYLWIAAAFRLLVLPICLLLFLYVHVPFPLLVVAVLTSAMPSATTTSVYAQKFGADASFASFGVLLTTVLCLFTLPLLYSLLHWLYPYFY